MPSHYCKICIASAIAVLYSFATSPIALAVIKYADAKPKMIGYVLADGTVADSVDYTIGRVDWDGNYMPWNMREVVQKDYSLVGCNNDDVAIAAMDIFNDSCNAMETSVGVYQLIDGKNKPVKPTVYFAANEHTDNLLSEVKFLQRAYEGEFTIGGAPYRGQLVGYVHNHPNTRKGVWPSTADAIASIKSGKDVYIAGCDKSVSARNRTLLVIRSSDGRIEDVGNVRLSAPVLQHHQSCMHNGERIFTGTIVGGDHCTIHGFNEQDVPENISEKDFLEQFGRTGYSAKNFSFLKTLVQRWQSNAREQDIKRTATTQENSVDSDENVELRSKNADSIDEITAEYAISLLKEDGAGVELAAALLGDDSTQVEKSQRKVAESLSK